MNFEPNKKHKKLILIAVITLFIILNFSLYTSDGFKLARSFVESSDKVRARIGGSYSTFYVPFGGLKIQGRGGGYGKINLIVYGDKVCHVSVRLNRREGVWQVRNAYLTCQDGLGSKEISRSSDSW